MVIGSNFNYKLIVLIISIGKIIITSLEVISGELGLDIVIFILFINRVFVTGHPHDTLYTSTCFHRLSNQRPITRLPQSTAIYGNLLCSAIFCLPVSTAISAISATSVTSAEFCQVLPGPRPEAYSAPCTC